MIVNCRSCKKNKPMPLAVAMFWTFHRGIYFCLDCVPANIRARMQEMEDEYWKLCF